jgi:hypothetical protein
MNVKTHKWAKVNIFYENDVQPFGWTTTGQQVEADGRAMRPRLQASVGDPYNTPSSSLNAEHTRE